MKMTYGVRFTDMSPFRAMRVDRLHALGMSEQTYGWNLEMQMRAASGGLRDPGNSGRSSVPPRRRLEGFGQSRRRLEGRLEDHDDFLRLALSLRSPASTMLATERQNLKALLTGGAGFIGQHVLRELLARGHEVRVLDSLRADVHAGAQWQPAVRRASVARRARRRGRRTARWRASKRCSISPPRSALASMSPTCRTTHRRTTPAPPSCWPAWRAPACRG